MKFLTSILFFSVFAIDSFAQNWVDIGAKGMINSTWIINRNVNNDKFAAYDLSLGYGVGGKVGFNFNEHVEITIDAIYGTVNQKYMSSGINNKWKREINLAYLDLPLLFKSNKEGTFIEIGPQFSMLMSAKETFSYDDPANGPGYIAETKYFEKSNIAAVFGFGSYLFGTENMYVCFGMRVAYGFLDIVSNEGGRKGADYTPITQDQSGSPVSYRASNNLSGGFVLELNYDLGYLVSSKCGKRRVIFF